MEKNIEMNQQEIFVNTLKDSVLANEKENILYDEKLNNYYKTLVVLFGRACIMQQLNSNVSEELCNERNELNRLKTEIERLITAEDSTLYDKELISKAKKKMEDLAEKYNILSTYNNEFYEKVADKILIEDLKLTTCTSSSIAEKMELLITDDLNKLFKRTDTGDDNSRLLELSEFKIVHDLLIDKKVIEEFNKDLYKFFSREEIQFLNFCYLNNKPVALKRLHDILLTNKNRAIKFLRVIYNQNNNNDKEFNIDDIKEIRKDYENNNYPYSKEFIKVCDYINSLDSDLNSLKKDITEFEKKLNMIKNENKRLYRFFNSKIMSELNNKPYDRFKYLYRFKENDYSFLSPTYLSKKKHVGATFDNINYAITLRPTKYEHEFLNIEKLLNQRLEQKVKVESLKETKVFTDEEKKIIEELTPGQLLENNEKEVLRIKIELDQILKKYNAVVEEKEYIEDTDDIDLMIAKTEDLIKRLEEVKKQEEKLDKKIEVIVKEDKLSEEEKILKEYERIKKEQYYSNPHKESKNTKEGIVIVVKEKSIYKIIDSEYKGNEHENIDEIIKKVFKEIETKSGYMKDFNRDNYIESIKGKISKICRSEADKKFVYPNQKNKVYFSPKKYRNLLLSEDFNNVFVRRDDSSLSNKYGVFILDNNSIFNLLIDKNSIYTRLNLFLFLKEVIGLYLNDSKLFINNKDKSSILSNDTICSFFSKFTETFNREENIFEIIKSYSDELIKNGYIEGLDNAKYESTMNIPSKKSQDFKKILDRININRRNSSK